MCPPLGGIVSPPRACPPAPTAMSQGTHFTVLTWQALQVLRGQQPGSRRCQEEWVPPPSSSRPGLFSLLRIGMLLLTLHQPHEFLKPRKTRSKIGLKTRSWLELVPCVASLLWPLEDRRPGQASTSHLLAHHDQGDLRDRTHI